MMGEGADGGQVLIMNQEGGKKMNREATKIKHNDNNQADEPISSSTQVALLSLARCLSSTQR